MIDFKKAYEIRNIKDNKVIDKIEEKSTRKVWYEAFKQLIAEGIPPLTLTKCKEANVINYQIYGNTEAGNIFNPSEANYIIGYFTRTVTTITTHANARTLYMPCLPNTAYKLTRDISFSQFHFGYTEEIPTVGVNVYNAVSMNNTSTMELSVTTGENAKYLVVYCYNGYVTTDNWYDIINSIQVLQTPTPDNPIQIESVGDRTINLFGNTESIWVSTTGVINTGTNAGKGVIIPTAEGEKFTVYAEWEELTGGNIIIFACFDSDMNFIANSRVVKNNVQSGILTKICPNNTAYIVCCHYTNIPSKIILLKGTYTIDTLPDYEPFGYKIPIKIRGKNVYNFSEDNIGKYVYNANGDTRYGFDFGVLKQGTYTLTINFIDDSNFFTYIYLRVLAEDGTFSSQYVTTNTQINSPLTFESDGTSHYYLIFASSSINTLDKAKTNWNLVKNAQLETGDTATEYEEYVEPETANIYLDKPIMKIGDDTDYIDLKNGETIRNINAKLLTSDLSWRDTYYPTILLTLSTDETAKYNNNTTVITKYSQNPYIRITNSTGTTIGFSNCDTYWGFETMDDLKAWLDEKGGIEAYYPLLTPKVEPITLPNLPLHKGTNIIEVDTDILPSNMIIQYYGK